MRVVIPAAGKGLRFRHYHEEREQFEKEGFTKHFLEIAGETILGRLVRLFQERGVEDIWVVGPDERYRLPGTRLFIPEQVPEHSDANKILNSASLWNPAGPTVIVYGDVWLTEEAVDAVLAESRPWVGFGRWGHHRWIDTPEELFGFKFGPEFHETNRQILSWVINLYQSKELPRVAGWEFYWGFNWDPRAFEVFDLTWLEINDMSDDVDTPEQYEALRTTVECSGRY